MDTENIDFKKTYLFDSTQPLVFATSLKNLKTSIKDELPPPSKNTKVYIVSFSVGVSNDKPFKISIGQFTLTPKLSVVVHDDDYGQTITFTAEEYKDYGFHISYIYDIIKAIKEDKISFAKLSIPVSDILKPLTKNIDFTKFHLFTASKSLLNADNLTQLKKLIKENVNPPEVNKKVWVANFSISETKKIPFTIIIGQYTLTPKLALVQKEDDRVQTFTFTKSEYSDFHLTTIGKIIKAFKNNKIPFDKMSVSISDILN